MGRGGGILAAVDDHDACTVVAGDVPPHASPARVADEDADPLDAACSVPERAVSGHDGVRAWRVADIEARSPVAAGEIMEEADAVQDESADPILAVPHGSDSPHRRLVREEHADPEAAEVVNAQVPDRHPPDRRNRFSALVEPAGDTDPVHATR